MTTDLFAYGALPEVRYLADARLAALGFALTKQAESRAVELRGRLYSSGSGWALLHVPNAIGEGAFRGLRLHGYSQPVSSTFQRYNAHISVMRPEEVEQAKGEGGRFHDFGKEFAYRLGRLIEIDTPQSPDHSKVVAFEVTSPDLSQLRRSYGLSGQPEHPFHMTVAVKRRGVMGSNGVSKA